MRLLAWRIGRVRTGLHISLNGRPLCGAPVPSRALALALRDARISDWAHICDDCRESVVGREEE